MALPSASYSLRLNASCRPETVYNSRYSAPLYCRSEETAEDADRQPALIPERSFGEARDKAASAVGVSPRYVRDAKKMEAHVPSLVDLAP